MNAYYEFVDNEALIFQSCLLYVTAVSQWSVWTVEGTALGN